MLLMYILNKCSGDIWCCFVSQTWAGRADRCRTLEEALSLIIAGLYHGEFIGDVSVSLRKQHFPPSNRPCTTCSRWVIAGLAFLIWGIELKGRSIEEIDARAYQVHSDQGSGGTDYLKKRCGVGAAVTTRRRPGCVESPGGLSPPGAPRSVREPLDSYGSRCSAVSMTSSSATARNGSRLSPAARAEFPVYQGLVPMALRKTGPKVAGMLGRPGFFAICDHTPPDGCEAKNRGFPQVFRESGFPA
jgi:hypothetical protein